jgi:TPR repeat protein
MHDEEQEVKQDFKETVKWYQQSADHGYAQAQCHLGLMYEYGKGVKKDVKQAVKWHHRSAGQGNKGASNFLFIWGWEVCI